MVVNHQNVDWVQYFYSIRNECPWSLKAYRQNLIDIVEYQGIVIPLGQYQARVYIIDADKDTIETICQSLDFGVDEWLFSYPGYGPFAAPVSCLIQQNRLQLAALRLKLKGE